ncbi:MAG: ParA family protein [Piscirickettsiaceae bacterium]|nr:ParA family protein [Piscirickettsiaceae bacterium]
MNQKGGVGKTTTTINLGHALALMGKNVMLLDMDPQGQVAASYGLDADIPGLDAVLLEDTAIDDVMVETRDNLTIVPAGKQLADFEHVSEGGSSRGHKLRLAIEGLSLQQDYILIDCPSSSGLLGINAMFAVGEVLVPVSSDYLSLQGLSRLMQILKRAESISGHDIRLWLVTTRMHIRRRLAHEIRKRILQYFPGRVFSTVIRESVALAECPSFGKTIFEYKQKNAGAEDYLSLAKDLIEGRTC